MAVVPMDIKEGMGVGTTFRVIGNFNGKRLEWDCETTEFDRNRRISAKQIDGPFKRWGITNEFESWPWCRWTSRRAWEWEPPSG